MSQLVTRPEWGAPDFTPVRIGPVSDVFVHHSVTNPYGNLRATMMMLEAHAIGLGHRAIDYSFCCFIDGQRAEGRGWFVAGGHTINNNSTSYGICGIGDYRFDPVTDEIVNAFIETINEGIEAGALVPPLRIRPHSDVFATACPANLEDAIPRIVAGIGGAPPTIEPTKGKSMFVHAETGSGEYKAYRGKHWVVAPNGRHTEINPTQWANYAPSGERFVGDASQIAQLLGLPPQ